MRKALWLLPLVALIPITSSAEGTDEGAMWTEIGIQKSINKQWKVGLETEMRAEKEARWSIGANASYKPIKYFKMGVSYNFLYKKSPEETKPHYGPYYVGDGETVFQDGYNLNEKYWSPRHRLSIDATGTIKVCRWLRISLRERYQFTRRTELTYDRVKVRWDGPKIDTVTGEYYFDTEDSEEELDPKTKSAESDNVLRSRLKLEMDKKGCPWGPFVSVESHNNLNCGQKMNLEKVRTGIGCEYKINKQHSLSLAYIFTANIHDDEDDHVRLHERDHAASIGYVFEF